MVSLTRNMTFNPKIRELTEFTFEKKLEAGDGVFTWHEFEMRQIPGFKFFLRICRTRIAMSPNEQLQPRRLTIDGINDVDNISNYFSVQLCVEKGPGTSDLSGLKLRGTLMLTQTAESGIHIHTMAGTIFGPNEDEEHYKEISRGLIQYGDYKYDPKSTRPAFSGWFFGTENPTFIDQNNSHVVWTSDSAEGGQWTSEGGEWTSEGGRWRSEADVYRDFYTVGDVPNLKIEVSIHLR